MSPLVALGDSLSCGQGVGVRVAEDATWPALLARRLPESDLTVLAVPGARADDVLRRQLPRALGLVPEVATVLVGLNDVVRGADGGAVGRTVAQVVQGLRDTGSTVLLVRLHEPWRQLPVPRRLSGVLHDRVAALNDVLDAQAADPGVLLLDLARVALLQDAGAWAVDRMHLSPVGHAAVSDAAARVLRLAGRAVVGRPAVLSPPPCPPGRAEELRWLVRHATPWAASHVREVVQPLLASALRPARAPLVDVAPA